MIIFSEMKKKCSTDKILTAFTVLQTVFTIINTVIMVFTLYK